MWQVLVRFTVATAAVWSCGLCCSLWRHTETRLLAAENEGSLELGTERINLRGPRDRWQLIVTGQTDSGPCDLTSKVAYASADESVARVTPGGLVLPVAEGTALLTARTDSGEASVNVVVHGFVSATPVSFAHDVIPALTKSGCNAGKCHGAPNGKGGFLLSLRGFDVRRDYERLTREIGGRRVNRQRPQDSLILLKPTGGLTHGGGIRFDAAHPHYRLLAQWIAEGTPPGADGTRPVELRIEPESRWLDPSAESQQLRVVARYDDETLRDVTHLARLSLDDDVAAELSPMGLLTRTGGGEVTVAAGYGSLQAASRIVFVKPHSEFAWVDPPRHNYVDRLVFAKLRRLRIAPAEVADDATFLRRVYLDICGILPMPDEVRAFLDNPREDKRQRLIDALLERPEYADFWAMKWTDRLGCNQRFVGKTGALKYHRWIRHQIATNLPEDRFVRTILTASGGNYSNPPAGFYRLPRTPEDRAEHVAQVFLGVRIGCARCHNHPGERWTQDDYYQLAAFFARLKYRDGPFFNHKYDKEETVIPTRSGAVRHGRTGEVVEAKPLGVETNDEPDQNAIEADPRERFADWLTAADNPFFARAAVNRIWFHLFGRGIVEPVDDFRSSNPPSNEPLLDALARDLVEHNYDRKHLIRRITNSRTYQLASGGDPADPDRFRYFASARVRLLGAEQLLDSISRATGVPEKFARFPLGLRAVQLADGEFQHRFLTTFGRPARSLACACERDSDSSLAQALELVGGSLIEEKIRSPQGRVSRLIADETDNETAVEELMLGTLSRPPSEEERQQLLLRLAKAEDRRVAIEDILWALLNHREFLFQH